jgi:tRNA (guanine-N7-)-methyltransferase
MRQVAISVGDHEWTLAESTAPLALNELVPRGGDWEVEIGFGKGRYLIRCASEVPEKRFLGVEMASAYYRLAARRMARKGLTNLVLIRGEALFVLTALLPRGFASAVHVYFPDPWPKARHQKRRLFDPESVDLVLDLLRPGGRLYFATDFVDYGRSVQELLESHPATRVRSLPGPWPDGSRTNYEAKYEQEGRAILRLEVEWRPTEATALHPAGREGVLAAISSRIGDLELAE